MTRPWNWARVQVPATLLGIFGGFYAVRAQHSGLSEALRANLPAIGWSVLAVATLSGGGYVINDYFDRDIDAINEPQRPIPAGVVTSMTAMAAAIALFIAGLVASYSVGRVNLAIAGLWVGFAVWYAVSLKRTGYGLQSLAFGIIMGLTTMFGSATVLHGLSNAPVWFVATFMALYITALHMTGTLKDIEGDAQGGCKTAAIVFGEARTRSLIPTVYLCAFLVLLYTSWRHLALDPVLSLLLSGIIALIVFMNVSALQAADHQSIVRAHGRSKSLLYAIFLVLISHFVLRTSP
jgi:geranylgeranylglycerol-phosphate geranylgeranyltransferase